jgi:hypothetical protein
MGMIDVIAIPALASIMGLLLIWAGGVRLMRVVKSEEGGGVSGLIYGLIGVAAGLAIVGYAVRAYLGR